MDAGGAVLFPSSATTIRAGVVQAPDVRIGMTPLVFPLPVLRLDSPVVLDFLLVHTGEIGGVI